MLFMKKQRVILRVFPFNRLTFPTLMNSWEKEGLDKYFEIIITEQKPVLKKNDVIFYSFMTPHLPIIAEEIKTIREKNIMIVGGGPHITGEVDLPKKLGFNILFRGFAEETFVRFGKDLLKNNFKKTVKIYEQTGNPDINKYYPLSKYFRTVPPLEIFRGCFWKCKYCQTGSTGRLFRDLDSIRFFLSKIKKRGFNRVTFISPSSLEFGAKRAGKPDIEKISNLFEIVRSFNFKFFEYGLFPSEIRPGTLSPELAEILKDNISNNRITMGAQSGLNSRLKELNRGHTTENVEEDVETAFKYGLKVNLDFILGYPDETGEEREITYKFIKKLSTKYNVKIHLHHFFPLSGSNYQFRLPEYLGTKDKGYLRELKKNGISTGWWENHESAVKKYFNWLKTEHPDFYDRYK